MFSWYSFQIFPSASRYYSSGSNYYWYNRIIIIIIIMSLVTGLFFLVILLNQQWFPPLRLQASHCSNFRIMCDVPSIAAFWSETNIIIIIIITTIIRPGIAQSVASKLWAGSDFWFSAGKRYFSLLHIIQTGYGAHPASYSMDAGVSFPRKWS